MHKNAATQSTGPFKAKLRHYHRTASPALYARKQKRWEDVSPSDLGDSSVSGAHGAIDLKRKLPEKKKTEG